MSKDFSTNLKGEESCVATKAIHQTRSLLLTGFGGILLLLAVLGLYGLATLRSIQQRNQQIRDQYVHRDRMLERLRSELYLSGTYVRDLLIDPDPDKAAFHRVNLERSRSVVQSLASSYDGPSSGQFRREMDSYFHLLEPALAWDASERRRLGYAFMQQSLLPRRMVIVHLADQLGQVNESQLADSSRQVDDLFGGFRQRFLMLLAITFSSGLSLAAISLFRVLRLERETADRFKEVADARSVLRDLSTRLVEVQESERKALSRELHDEVGQALSGLLLGMANLAAILPMDTEEEAGREIQKLRRLTERTVATVRDMSLLLRPSMLDDLGLLPALQWQAREVSRNSNLNVTVKAESLPEDLSDDQRTCVYRIVQEALRNIDRHANATAVDISINTVDHRLILQIQDNGRGFNPAFERGLGLLGMEERVKHLGGSFKVESEPGCGSRLTAVVTV